MKKRLSLLAALLMALPLFGQQHSEYEAIADSASQMRIVEHLCDSIMAGRASGSDGSANARRYILNYLDQLQVQPFFYRSTQKFYHKGGVQMQNILAVVPALGVSDKYVVVSAHYDHLGTIKGKTYPGADDNASGVSALLTLSQMFSRMRRDSVGPGVNILFVLFDGKEYSMAGSEHFMSTLPVAPDKIICNVNMDILGSTLVPPKGYGSDYMIVLGRGTLPRSSRDLIDSCNKAGGDALEIDYTFYGSDDFTQMMYKLGDHYSFSKKGIPALLFTSGFHNHTLKTTDTPAIVNGEVLARRTRLIFRVIDALAQ